MVDDAFRHDIKDVAGEAEGTFLQMLQDPKAYVLALVYFFLLGATYTMVFWVPTLIQSWGVKDLFLIGIYASIPNAAGVIGMILIGRHSDKWHERRWHFAVCVVIAAVGLFTTTLFQGQFGRIDPGSRRRCHRDRLGDSALFRADERVSVGRGRRRRSCTHQQPRKPRSGGQPVDQWVNPEKHRRQYIQHVLRDGVVPAVRNASAADDTSGLGRGCCRRRRPRIEGRRVHERTCRSRAIQGCRWA